jgi:maltooligosyltrehalose trehalohydrolase
MPAQHLPPQRFVVSIQTHDQIGNRMLGERLGQQLNFEQSKLAAGLMLWSPYIPMLFMGEEYGETAPFLYFVHHGDADVIDGVRLGRKAEFASFAWLGEVPDPQAEETFRRTQLDWSLLDQPQHQALWSFYQTLIRTRKELPALATRSRQAVRVDAYDAWSTLVARWHSAGHTALITFCLSDRPIRLPLALPPGRWKRLVDSADSLYQGPGNAMPAELSGGGVELDLAPHSCALWVCEMDS